MSNHYIVSGYIFKKGSHKPNLNYFIKDFENWWKITAWGKKKMKFGISNKSIIYLFIFVKLRDRETNQ